MDDGVKVLDSPVPRRTFWSEEGVARGKGRCSVMPASQEGLEIACKPLLGLLVEPSVHISESCASGGTASSVQAEVII